MKTGCVVLAAALAVLAGGCASGTSRINPNPEKSLQKKPKELVAYAAEKEFPVDAQKMEQSPVLAEVDYGLDVINLVNLGTEDWQDVDVWVNQQYVVKLGSLPVGRQRGINFHLLYDKAGQRAPSKGVWVKSIEIVRGDEVYSPRVRMAD